MNWSNSSNSARSKTKIGKTRMSSVQSIRRPVPIKEACFVIIFWTMKRTTKHFNEWAWQFFCKFYSAFLLEEPFMYFVVFGPIHTSSSSPLKKPVWSLFFELWRERQNILMNGHNIFRHKFIHYFYIKI